MAHRNFTTGSDLLVLTLRFIAAVCFAVSLYLILGGSSSDRPLGDEAHDTRSTTAQIASTAKSSDHATTTKPIEEIRVGERVLARNPAIDEAERAKWSEPDWSEWLHLSLQMPLPLTDGPSDEPRVLNVELLRPESWIRQRMRFVTTTAKDDHGTIADSAMLPTSRKERPKHPLVPLSPLRPTYRDLAFTSALLEASGVELIAVAADLDLPEMGASGTAIIADIRACPSVKSGAGQVVTATFSHPPSTEVLNVTFAGEAEPIGVTDNHLFWSVDRQQFKAIGQMNIGERVQTYHGETKRIVSKLARPGPQTVYNLEVYGEHVYFVGDAGLLAHNAYGTASTETAEDILVLGRGSPEELSDVAQVVGGRVIDNHAISANPRLLWKAIHREMRVADEITQVTDGIPSHQVLGRGTGAWARAEKIFIDTMEGLREKTTRVRRVDLGLKPR